MRVILASASPRRAALLRSAGIDFEVRPAEVDESVHAGEGAEQYARRVAGVKARSAAAPQGQVPVIGADTVVVVDGVILGKPRDGEDAARMLRLLSGRRHEVLTAVALVRATAPGETATEAEVARTAVDFIPLAEDEIARYVASGEPMDKAGAYAIQGLAGRFVWRIEGSYSNVVGLPLDLVFRMLTREPRVAAPSV